MGQTLTVPKVPLNANSADTLQPYEPGKVIGSQDPVLPAPAAKGGGCGGVGKIIMAVVAVVVSFYTAGLASGMIGSTLFGSTTAASFAAGALGAAAGSIASQVVGIAIGAQEDFSWKSVGLAALSGGITNGLAETQLLGGKGLEMTIARAATANALTQGIGVATGLQKSFDWKGVAGAAVGAGVGWGLNEALGVTVGGERNLNANASNQAFFGMGAAGAVLRGTLSGLGAGTAAAVARGGKVAIQQVATDAFGNALGSSLAESLQPAAPSMYSLGGSGRSATGLRVPTDWSDGLGRSNDVAVYGQFVNAFSNPTQFDGGDSVLLAAGPGYSGMGMSGGDRLQVNRDISVFEEASALAASSGRASVNRSSGLYASGFGDVRDTSPAAGLLVNPETGLADFKYTSQVSNSINASWDGLFSDGGPTASHDDSIKEDQGYLPSLGGIAGSDLSFADKLSMAWGTTKYYFRNSGNAQGAAQMIGGGMELLGAASLSTTGLGAVVGIPLAFHGGDSIGTGFSRIMGNGDGSTLTYQSAYALTGSAMFASTVDQAIPFAGGVGAVASSMRSAWTVTTADIADGMRYEASQAATSTTPFLRGGLKSEVQHRWLIFNEW